MVKKEFFKTRMDGVNLWRSYSDQNVMIQKDGTDETYSEAIDVEDSGFTYTETNIAIDNEHDIDDEQAEKAAAYDIIVGGEQDETD